MNIEKYKQTLTSNKMNNPEKLNVILKNMPSYIKQNGSFKIYKKSELLYEKSEDVNYVYYIIRGSFVVVNEFESGRIYEPVILYGDDFIGAVEAIIGKPDVISTIVANETSEVLRFKTEDFKRWLKENHDLTRVVLHSVSVNFTKNMVESGEQIILNTRYLMVNHLLQQSTKQDDLNILDESRDKTSIRTGINIRTLYRHIRELKEQKLIDTKGRKVYFTDTQKEHLLDFMKELRNK